MITTDDAPKAASRRACEDSERFRAHLRGWFKAHGNDWLPRERLLQHDNAVSADGKRWSPEYADELALLCGGYAEIGAEGYRLGAGDVPESSLVAPSAPSTRGAHRSPKETPGFAADRERLVLILNESAGWMQFKHICHDHRAIGSGGRPWSRRYVSMLAESTEGRIISSNRGYRLQEKSPRELIFESHRSLRDKGKSSIHHANQTIIYFNKKIDGKVTLPDYDALRDGPGVQSTGTPIEGSDILADLND